MQSCGAFVSVGAAELAGKVVVGCEGGHSLGECQKDRTLLDAVLLEPLR